jgi:nitroreductase
MLMDFYDVLKGRHSVRAFQDKDIQDKVLRKILGVATMAPSAGNLQSYKICIVRSAELKEELAGAAEYQEFLAGAPVILVFCADQKLSESRYGARGFELFAVQDATLAASYCQLAATAEGLSSAWVGSFEPLEVSRLLSLLAYEVPVAIIALGYPAGEAEETRRRPLNDVLREI